MSYRRGDVVKGPDLFAEHDFRPYVCLSDETHPFSEQEATYAAVTTTEWSVAIPLTDADFERGGLPRRSYVNPWTLAPIRHADIHGTEGRLTAETTERIAHEAARYLGVTP